MRLPDWAQRLRDLVLGPLPGMAASCFRYREDIFLCASCLTGAGFHFDAEPWRKLQSQQSDEALGCALRTVLGGSERVIPTPDREGMRRSRKELLRAAGMRSERQLQMQSVCVLVVRSKASLQFIPSRNGGTRGDRKGFHHLNDAMLALPVNAPSTVLGATLRAAFERCTSVYEMLQE